MCIRERAKDNYLVYEPGPWLVLVDLRPSLSQLITIFSGAPVSQNVQRLRYDLCKAQRGPRISQERGSNFEAGRTASSCLALTQITRSPPCFVSHRIWLPPVFASLQDQSRSIEATTAPSAFSGATLGLTPRSSSWTFEGSEQYEGLTLKDWPILVNPITLPRVPPGDVGMFVKYARFLARTLQTTYIFSPP